MRQPTRSSNQLKATIRLNRTPSNVDHRCSRIEHQPIRTRMIILPAVGVRCANCTQPDGIRSQHTLRARIARIAIWNNRVHTNLLRTQTAAQMQTISQSRTRCGCSVQCVHLRACDNTHAVRVPNVCRICGFIGDILTVPNAVRMMMMTRSCANRNGFDAIDCFFLPASHSQMKRKSRFRCNADWEATNLSAHLLELAHRCTLHVHSEHDFRARCSLLQKMPLGGTTVRLFVHRIVHQPEAGAQLLSASSLSSASKVRRNVITVNAQNS